MDVDKFKKPGFVYILINPSLQQNMLKVGMTTRSPEERAAEISRATGVPTPFFVAYKVSTSNCEVLEKTVHQKLKPYLYKNNREFFIVDLDVVIRILHESSLSLEKTYTNLILILQYIGEILDENYDKYNYKLIESTWKSELIVNILAVSSLTKNLESECFDYLLYGITKLLIICLKTLEYYDGDRQLSLFSDGPSDDEINELKNLKKKLNQCLLLLLNFSESDTSKVLSQAMNTLIKSSNPSYLEFALNSLLNKNIKFDGSQINYKRIRFLAKSYKDDDSQSLHISTLAYINLLKSSTIVEADLADIFRLFNINYCDEMNDAMLSEAFLFFGCQSIADNYIDNDDLSETLDQLISGLDTDIAIYGLTDSLTDSLEIFLALVHKYIKYHNKQVSTDFLRNYLRLMISIDIEEYNLSIDDIEEYIMTLTALMHQKNDNDLLRSDIQDLILN